jgi:hypothetical protein
MTEGPELLLFGERIRWSDIVSRRLHRLDDLAGDIVAAKAGKGAGDAPGDDGVPTLKQRGEDFG